MGAHVDRLAAHLRAIPDAERPIAGRVGGLLWITCGLANLLLPLFPQAHATLLPWIALISVIATLWGVTAMVIIDWRRAPAWVIPVANAMAGILVGVIIELSGGIASPARPDTFPVMVYAACFLSVRQATVIMFGCAAIWAMPVLDRNPPLAALGEMLLVLPVFAIVGLTLIAGRKLLTAMRTGAERLYEEHDARRVIATAVAAGHAPDVIFDLAAEQAARLLRADGASLLSFDGDDHLTIVGTWAAAGGPARRASVGARHALADSLDMRRLRDEDRPLRVDDYAGRSDAQAQRISALGYRAWVGAPVHGRGRLWGALCACTVAPDGLPDDAELQLSGLAELVGMAVVNIEEAARLTADATTDPLTGLANHRAYQERLRAELARADRHQRPLAVALVDVDDFKHVNDTGGHAVGDQVLRAVAAHLRAELRAGDVLARVGGDEFAVLLPEASGADAAAAL